MKTFQLSTLQTKAYSLQILAIMSKLDNNTDNIKLGKNIKRKINSVLPRGKAYQKLLWINK